MATDDSMTLATNKTANSEMVRDCTVSSRPQGLKASVEDGATKQVAVTDQSAAPIQATTSTRSTAAKPKPPPPGYKLVRRRKEDGTTVTVMRKMTPEELEASGQKEPSPTAPKEGVEYKIVTVKNTDGSFVRVKRPIKPTENQPPAASDPTKTTSNAKNPGPVINTETKAKDQAQSTVTSNPTTCDDAQRSIELATRPVGETINEPMNMSVALADQKEYFRQRRMQKFKGSMIRGLGTVLGSSVSHMDFGSSNDSHHGGHGDLDEIQEGDIIDSDEDWSEDDMDEAPDHDHNHDHDDTLHNDHSNATHSGSFETLVHLDSAGATRALITGVTASAASATGTPQKPAPVAIPPNALGSSKDIPSKEKITYNVTIKDLEESEKKSAEKDVERPLRRHWTNFTFYFMASLSIVLPLLFLLLGLFIFLMNKKPVDSSWKVMPDVIKVGVSAWPIIFAAVVAQVFKGYATWRVERGIRLMQLEQLMGSNSFGSAIKQPLVLRQLDTLSILLLATWCLSPVGSQALQRSYTTSTNDQVVNTTVYYLDQLTNNKVFSNDWRTRTTEILHASDNQFVAIEFLSTLLPVDQSNSSDLSSYWMDRYFHPIIYKSNEFPVAGMGLPVVLPNTLIPSTAATTDKNTPYEYITFNVTSSYYNFTCSDWTIQNSSVLHAADPAYAWSSSGTLGMVFDNGSTTSISHVMFASANIDADVAGSSNITNATFSHIECDFVQVFIDTEITCERTAPVKDSTHSNIESMCYAGNATLTPEDVIESGNYGTQLEDFSDDWTQMGSFVNSNRQGKFSTPTELYLLSDSYQMDYTSYSATRINLSATVPANYFSDTFGNLFNTWVGLGYCPECQALTNVNDLNSMDASVQERFLDADATLQYSIGQIYVIDVPWVVCFIVCTALLLLAGAASVIVESMTVAPDTLGYVSTVARNSRYLHVKPTSGAMTGPERARKLADTKVMMQDVKSKAGVGKIALGLKTENAVKLRYDRLYR